MTYPFRHWVQDVVVWSVYSDLAGERKGPAVELALSGTARDLVRELPLDHKSRGIMADMGDGQGVRHVGGLELIIRLLHHNFSYLDDEEANWLASSGQSALLMQHCNYFKGLMLKF